MAQQRRPAAGQQHPGIRLLFDAEDVAGRGAAILDRRWRIRAANRTAGALLRAGATVQIVDGCLAARDPGSDRQFGGALGAALDARQPSELIALPGAGDGWIVVCALPFPGSVSEILLLIDDAAASRAARFAGFARRYGLTTAEARLLDEIVAGRSLGQAAARQRRSAHTLRNQLKAILAKSGAARQASLVSIVLGGSHVSAERTA